MPIGGGAVVVLRERVAVHPETSYRAAATNVASSIPFSTRFDQLRSVSRSAVRWSSTSWNDAEVDQRQCSGSTALDLVERSLPCLEVDLRRRTGREHETARLDAHARRVAGVERAVRIEVADVVPRVAGRREAFEPDDAVADDVDVLLRHRRELAPERVEPVAVEPSRARLELRRVDQVRRSHVGDVHLQAGVLPHENAGRAGVVEVDVGEEEMADVGQSEAALCEPRLRVARRRSSARSRGARARPRSRAGRSR